jgi:hypothetical protein
MKSRGLGKNFQRSKKEKNAYFEKTEKRKRNE